MRQRTGLSSIEGSWTLAIGGDSSLNFPFRTVSGSKSYKIGHSTNIKNDTMFYLASFVAITFHNFVVAMTFGLGDSQATHVHTTFQPLLYLYVLDVSIYNFLAITLLYDCVRRFWQKR